MNIDIVCFFDDRENIFTGGGYGCGELSMIVDMSEYFQCFTHGNFLFCSFMYVSLFS